MKLEKLKRKVNKKGYMPVNQTPLTSPYCVLDVMFKSHSATGKA